MTEEHTSRLWVCARCGRRKNIALVPDPVLLKVCDECGIENWCRNPVGAGVVTKAEPEPVIEAETIETDLEITEVLEEAEPELSEKEKEIEGLKAKLAELEGNE